MMVKLMVPLQVGYFLDPLPPEAPTTLVAIGLLLIVQSQTRRVLEWRYAATVQQDTLDKTSRLLAVGIVGTTYMVMLLSGTDWQFAIFVFVIGQTMEGALSVRILVFIYVYIKVFRKMWSTSSLRTILEKWEQLPGDLLGNIVKLSIATIAGMGAAGSLFYIWIIEPGYQSDFRQTLIIWTSETILVSLIAVSWRVREIVERVGRRSTVGFVFIVAGATTYKLPDSPTLNLPIPIGIPYGDLLAFVFGFTGYWVGFGYAFVILIWRGQARELVDSV